MASGFVIGIMFWAWVYSQHIWDRVLGLGLDSMNGYRIVLGSGFRV